jgi:chromosome segregation protein
MAAPQARTSKGFRQARTVADRCPNPQPPWPLVVRGTPYQTTSHSMRLTTIKLSGFKSFVDPTLIHLPTNLTGIVGPNGCGKSNIIDAIRWVMGESAASRLRGDQLVDVIFSGSSARKPVGSATVELIFDNSDGTIVGEYARFNEISVKRTVSRDGVSVYSLNGSRCRRRDITDLFLGTGLGARSYSIIEQGMISQIVEAHPEELRVHLEEAAGISKYKERRKETESRIRSTRENLERLNDVREEVDKQLEHLKRQARAAERYTKLKDEYRHLDARLKALGYRALEQERAQAARALKEAELDIEKLVADQRAVEARLEAQRGEQTQAGERLNKAQAEVYRVGGDIARVEQQIRHTRELGERLERSREETTQALRDLDLHIANDGKQLEELDAILARSEPQLAELNSQAEARAEALKQAEQALADWQQRWDAFAREQSEANRAAEVERTRLDYLDRQCLEVSQRLKELEQERTRLDMSQLASAADALVQQQEEQKAKVESLGAALEARRGDLSGCLERERTSQADLAAQRQELQATRGRLASLEALQHAALGQDDGDVRQWLSDQALASARRVGEALEVTPGWERAVETVLGGLLEAVLVEDPSAHLDAMAALETTSLALVREGGDTPAIAPDSLAAKVQGPAPVLALLASVRVADDTDAARERARSLHSSESVITADGLWLGRGWLRIARGQDAQVGVLAREREIHGLREAVVALDARVAALGSELDTHKAAIAAAEQARDDAQRELHQAHRALSELGGQIKSQQGRLESAQARMTQIVQEVGQLGSRLKDEEDATRAARAALEQALARMAEFEQQRQKLDGERRGLSELREAARAEARDARDQAHQVALRIESRRSAATSLRQALERMQQQREQLEARQNDLVEQLKAGESPLETLEAERQRCLEERLSVDKLLAEARRAMEACEAEFRDFEQQRQRLDVEIGARRDALSEQRMAEQALRLRAEGFSRAVIEAGLDLEAVLAEVPEEADPEVWQQDLLNLETKIRRLEPVNLAAIQEYEEQSRRKEYLDAQNTDLTTALETLESAIRKIDRETRTRFKETFDRVNTGLQELFPRLFGGGHAYLELTGDDLLSTGVGIMARPPGKRVTSISLLSGGEKALTAVALVFAIFRLNPAPFCLLDEVDAPLDEANVGRFCEMVREMSENVQFVVVTHNKVTMEYSHQLAGVTMREPGVSRLVTVDLAEAATLAGAA